MLEKERFEEICSILSIDEVIKKEAIKHFGEVQRDTILDVS
jgi:hypothetical protein